GTVALLLARDVPPLLAPTSGPEVTEATPEEVREGLLLALVFGASGFLAVGYEVLWFRLLAYHANNTVYTFSVMLAVYLTGLVVGALACALWVGRDKGALLASFARVQLGIAIAASVSLGFAGQGGTILEKLGYSGLSAGSLGSLVLLVAIVLLVPTTLIGMSFPLASELSVVRLAKVGGRVGLLYSLNTFGGVLGSLVAGMVLLPLLGVQASFQLLILGNLALFGVLWLTQPALRTPSLRREAVLTTLGVVGFAVALGPSWLVHQLTRSYPGELLVFEETDDATFMVLEHQDERVGPYQQLAVNGTSYANNRPEGMR
ncbi:MAG: fused MFS/spermidine synthase, partial [Myxococcales bacterium]|nr:fused MFS/spermidine synthase [Myxococcales bacterium]